MLYGTVLMKQLNTRISEDLTLFVGLIDSICNKVICHTPLSETKNELDLDLALCDHFFSPD